MTAVTMTSLYSLLGIPAGISGAATVLTRVLTVWLRIFVGYVVVQWTGITILKETPYNSPKNSPFLRN